VIQAASLVVVVRPADPPSSVQEVPVVPPTLEPGEPRFRDPDAPIPPYPKLRLHYVVEEVILDQTGLGVSAGQTITAAKANWRRAMALHISYHFRGLSKSPVYQQYRGSRADGEVPCIAFMSEHEDGLRIAFDGAFESLGARNQVLEAIAKRAPGVGGGRSRRRGFWSWLLGRKG
jgi:hypothetical protein